MKLLLLLILSNILFAIELPENIYLDTDITATTVTHYYAAHQDKLWYKANPDTNPIGAPQTWTIFHDGGIPVDLETKQPIMEGNKITAVYADGDVISILDENRRVYVYQTSSRAYPLEVPYRWVNRWGAPISDALYIPSNIRSMALTRRSANTIEYMEDRIGNQIKGGGEGPLNENGEGSFGGLIHIFLLSEDGTEINYADTGLPPGFGYRYATPYRGRFIAESMAGSGSIVFLLGRSGRIFSRPLDFDMNGNNPMMYDYTYWPIPNEKYDGDNTDRFGYVNLPAIPWYQESEIEIFGDRAITKKITMVSTGSGNKERELRVQGRNEDGKYGYFFKQIFNRENWQFRETGELFTSKEIILSADTRQEFKLGPVKDLSFEGSMNIKKFFGQKTYRAKILDYNLVDSPATIQVTLPSGEMFPLLIHTVDMWTMQTIDDPGRDGTPKLSLGTIEVPERVLGTTNRNIRTFLEKYLLKAHLAEFRFNVMASKDFVVIESRDKNLPIKWAFNRGPISIPNPEKINGYLSFLRESKTRDQDLKLLSKYRKLKEEAEHQLLLQRGANLGSQFIEALPIVGWINEWSTFPAPRKLFRWGPIVVHSRIEILKKQVHDLSEVIIILKART